MSEPRVRVTFYLEPDEPDHRTGLTEETFNLVTDAIMEVGGGDYEIALVEGEEE